MTIPKKPKQPIRSDFAKGFDGMEDFASAEINYYKTLATYERARAERAQLSGVSP